MQVSIVEATVKLDGKHALEQNSPEKKLIELEHVLVCSQAKAGLTCKALSDQKKWK
jgi:hypothetical protein